MTFASFRSVIELWASREEMASDIGAKPSAVSKWWQRDRIPDDWWWSILSTGKAREAGLTADMLAELAARPEPGVWPSVPAEATA